MNLWLATFKVALKILRVKTIPQMIEENREVFDRLAEK